MKPESKKRRRKKTSGRKSPTYTQPKRNPYDVDWVMERDGCDYQTAVDTIQELKIRTRPKNNNASNRRNIYDPLYVMERENIPYDDAVKWVEEYKAQKATSLPNFIRKYGEEEGKKRYDEWMNKSLKKGHELTGDDAKARSRSSLIFYIRNGHNEEEAKQMALDYQHTTSPLHVRYYTSRGLSVENAKQSIRIIHDKLIGRDGVRENLERTTSLTGEEITEEIRRIRGHCTKERLGEEGFADRIRRTRKTFEQKGLWAPLETLGEYDFYRYEVWKVTNSCPLHTLPHFEKRGRAGVEGAYHLDHKFSILMGFIQGVPADVIGSMSNLEFIPWEDNVRKQAACSIELEELMNAEGVNCNEDQENQS